MAGLSPLSATVDYGGERLMAVQIRMLLLGADMQSLLVSCAQADEAPKVSSLFQSRALTICTPRWDPR